MNLKSSLTAVILLTIAHVLLLFGGCSPPQQSAEENTRHGEHERDAHQNGTPARLSKAGKQHAGYQQVGRRTYRNSRRSKPSRDRCVLLARLRASGCAIYPLNPVPINRIPSAEPERKIKRRPPVSYHN